MKLRYYLLIAAAFSSIVAAMSQELDFIPQNYTLTQDSETHVFDSRLSTHVVDTLDLNGFELTIIKNTRVIASYITGIGLITVQHNAQLQVQGGIGTHVIIHEHVVNTYTKYNLKNPHPRAPAMRRPEDIELPKRF